MAGETAIDKSTWGDGPWQTEPDRVDFVAHGFACLALRNPESGHWCGYVGVPEGHPYFGASYHDLSLDFHGGVNYSEPCDGDVCHTPAPGMPDHVWWLGGDFGHTWDKSPGLEAQMREFIGRIGKPGGERSLNLLFGGRKYRDLVYVRWQIEGLAAQLRVVGQ